MSVEVLLFHVIENDAIICEW